MARNYSNIEMNKWFSPLVDCPFSGALRAVS